jgi:hypothetical protein
MIEGRVDWIKLAQDRESGWMSWTLMNDQQKINCVQTDGILVLQNGAR